MESYKKTQNKPKYGKERDWQEQLDEPLKQILSAEQDYAEAHAKGSGGSGGGTGYGGNDTPATRYDHDDAADADAYISRGNGGRGDGYVPLSAEAQAFLDSLPYPHSGSNTARYDEMVLERLKKADLSNSDKEAIAYNLGL